MKTTPAPLARWAGLGIGALLLVIAYLTHERWLPAAQQWMGTLATTAKKTAEAEGDSGHEGHDDHDHGGHGHEHDNANSLELSAQAQGNLGLTEEFLQPIQLETFQRTITVPGILVERPGRTRLEVSTPMAGVITKVYAVEGEAVTPGALLFDLRITAEELVDSQTELLKTVGDLDVENREIARLTKVSEIISQRSLLERQYAKNKLENLLLAQREALRLHGLSDNQIGEIVEKRRLFRDLRVVAPSPGNSSAEIQLADNAVRPTSLTTQESEQEASKQTPLIVTKMPVLVGQTVAAGTTLAEIADYSDLYIEGRTFERDAKTLSQVAKNGWKISALFESADNVQEMVPDLELVYSATAVEVDSRTLPFYVRLPNQLLSRTPTEDGHSFVEWQYRPGRRVQLLVPVAEMKDQIVLPVAAIAREGAESYVFQQNGDHFDRVPVRVTYRDANFAVLASDGSIFPGDVIARVGAHQMQMALKNKSGGGADPHAGHNH